MTRTIETECAACGEELTIDLTGDAGADGWSVRQRDDYCSWTCEQEAF